MGDGNSEFQNFLIVMDGLNAVMYGLENGPSWAGIKAGIDEILSMCVQSIIFLVLLVVIIEILFILDRLRLYLLYKLARLPEKTKKWMLSRLHLLWFLLWRVIGWVLDRVCLALRCLYRGVCRKYASWVQTT